MELIMMLRYFCFCVPLQLVGANGSYTEWLKMTGRAEQRERHARENDLKGVDSNLITAGKPRSCCKNDGICIMNAFCHCKKHFYGRFCQHRVKHRSCGSIAHGTWMAVACNICHCYDGSIICKKSNFPNCADTFKDGVEQEPEYSGGIEKEFEDYDKFYDEYEAETSSGSSSRICLTHMLVLVVVTLTCLGQVS